MKYSAEVWENWCYQRWYLVKRTHMSVPVAGVYSYSEIWPDQRWIHNQSLSRNSRKTQINTLEISVLFMSDFNLSNNSYIEAGILRWNVVNAHKLQNELKYHKKKKDADILSVVCQWSDVYSAFLWWLKNEKQCNGYFKPPKETVQTNIFLDHLHTVWNWCILWKLIGYLI